MPQVTAVDDQFGTHHKALSRGNDPVASGTGG